MADVRPTPPSRSQRGYDRLAPIYHWTEWLAFGNQLQHARVALIDKLPPWQRLLVLGDGNGRLLAQLGAQCLQREKCSCQPKSSIRIESLDHSPAMLRLQQLRVNALGLAKCVELIELDALQYRPQVGAYDVVVTPFFLDCFAQTELEQYLPRWLAALRPGGLLYYVDFIVPQSLCQRPRAQLLLWGMHLFFGWQTGLSNRQLVDTQPLFEQCGLRKVSERIGGRGMLTTQLWQATQP